MLTLTPTLARRLFIAKQCLAGERPAPTLDGMRQLFRHLGCVQLDPISAVERTHWLVLWSRLGQYDRQHLDQLLWRERHLFEYWAHCASIVLTEDYPLHAPLMRGYGWSERTLAWVKQNAKLKRYVLTELRQRGPLLSRDLAEDGIHPEEWVSTGWTSGRNISRMLDYLWIGGQIMVAGREGIQKKWDLAERVLPEWTPRERLNPREVTRRAAEQALRALGVATPTQIQHHFIRGRYADLPQALADLEKQGQIQRVAIPEWKKGVWYIHTADLSLVSNLQSPFPRTTLLSPFDNLICDRARTRQFFDFDFTIEIYVPAAKRKFGYYVLPILHNDALIGRIDPTMERDTGTLRINAVYAETAAPASAGPQIAQAVRDLGTFLGAEKIVYNQTQLPKLWKKALQA